MNKQLSNFISRSLGVLPVVRYQYVCPAKGEIADVIAKGDSKYFKPEIKTNTINHKRRVKRMLTQLLKSNPRLITIEQKQGLAALVMVSYKNQLLGRLEANKKAKANGETNSTGSTEQEDKK